VRYQDCYLCDRNRLLLILSSSTHKHLFLVVTLLYIVLVSCHDHWAGRLLLLK
jgi:hypothetical protein